MDDRAYQQLLARLQKQLEDFDKIEDAELKSLKSLDGVVLRYGELRMLLDSIRDLTKIRQHD